MFDALAARLRRRGHEVITLEPDNRSIAGLSGRVGAALSGIWSPAAQGAMSQLLRRERPEVVHLHNLYPLLSPSVVAACRAAAVPVVMSLHDYKLLCPTAQYFRDGAPCRRCSGGREIQCVLGNCRGNVLESAAYALRTAAARRGEWLTRGVDRFVACSEFVRRRHVEEGFPAERVAVIPNFVEIPLRLDSPPRGEYAAFLGRLSPEKGIAPLLQAARICGVPLRIAGAGDAGPAAAEAGPNVRFVGPLSRDGLAAFFAGAAFAVVPSLFEEPFGLVAAEAMGHGLPVIASRTGGLAGLVEDGVDGFLVPPADAGALAERMALLWSDRDRAAAMGTAARRKARHDFDPERYCERLERLYQQVAEPAAIPAAAPV
jgi:glycosyltransferase involved in cell wall biosynthesis